MHLSLQTRKVGVNSIRCMPGRPIRPTLSSANIPGDNDLPCETRFRETRYTGAAGSDAGLEMASLQVPPIHGKDGSTGNAANTILASITAPLRMFDVVVNIKLIVNVHTA